MQIKKQSMEELFRTTFRQTIDFYKPDNFYFSGRKMYVRLENTVIVSVDFSGTELAYNNIVLMASNKYGILDQNITPFKILFKESKAESGNEKMINLKQILGATGIFSCIWNTDIENQDFEALNNHLITYIELFSSI